VLGKYSTKVVLPKTKSELVTQINSLGQVEIRVIEPIDKSNVNIVKLEIDRVVRKGRTSCIVLIAI